MAIHQRFVRRVHGIAGNHRESQFGGTNLRWFVHRVQAPTQRAYRLDDDDPVVTRIPAGPQRSEDLAAAQWKSAVERGAGLPDGATIRPRVTEYQDQPVDTRIQLFALAGPSLSLHIADSRPDVETDPAPRLDRTGVEGTQVARTDEHLEDPLEGRSNVRLQPIHHPELPRVAHRCTDRKHVRAHHQADHGRMSHQVLDGNRANKTALDPADRRRRATQSSGNGRLAESSLKPGLAELIAKPSPQLIAAPPRLIKHPNDSWHRRMLPSESLLAPYPRICTAKDPRICRAKGGVCPFAPGARTRQVCRDSTCLRAPGARGRGEKLLGEPTSTG